MIASDQIAGGRSNTIVLIHGLWMTPRSWECFTGFVPGLARSIFQAAFANFSPWAATTVNRNHHDRAPLLLINGVEDNLVPPVINEINQWLYQGSEAVTDYMEFPGRSHLIIAQEGWKEVADFALSWAQEYLSDPTLQPALVLQATA